MKIKHQLSIATLVTVGIFATGCSQQQVEGGTQVAGGSQQQQNEPQVVVAPKPPKTMAVKPQPVKKVTPRRTVRRVVRNNPWLHYHPEAPKCAKTRKHSHKFKRTGAPHRHRYACAQQRTRYVKPRTRYVKPRTHYVKPAVQPQVDVRALQTKLKAKGFYRGPIDGIVGSGTRSALKRFMNR